MGCGQLILAAKIDCSSKILDEWYIPEIKLKYTEKAGVVARWLLHCD